MLRNDYFVECLQSGKYVELAWINSILAITNLRQMEDTSPDELEPYTLTKGANEHYWFVDPVSKEFVEIEDANIESPLFYRKELVTLPPSTINIPGDWKPLVTTIGNAITNACLLFKPLGKRIPYMNGGKGIEIDKIDPGAMSKKVTQLVLSDEEIIALDNPDPNSYITVPQLVDWMQCVSWIAGLATLVAASVSEKSVRIAPEVLKRRDELYEEFKDQLGNPAIQARIEDELVKMDKASLKDDPSYDFYYQSKHWANTRKKKLITTGIISSISGDPVFIAKPLIAGIDAEDIPAYSDSIRHSSYSRGHLTALGGELVKYIFRVTQNIKIVEPDCKTPYGLKDHILPGYEGLYMGRYLMQGDKLIEITAENVTGLLNKDILIRSPSYCRTADGNFCEVCMGKDLSRTPNAIHTAASQPGSVMMNASMKAMHGKALKNVIFDPLTAIT